MKRRLYKVQQRIVFRTPVRIKIPIQYPDSLFEEFFSVLERVNITFNSHQAKSVVSRINQQAGRFVEVDEETFSLFTQVLYWSDITNGCFDITITPLLRLWGFYSDFPAKPTRIELNAILQNVNYKQIELERGRIRIDKGQEITTGGFLKGYAIDCLLKEMKRRGIEDVVVNAGGSSIACLNDKQHPYCQIQINHPVTHLKVGYWEVKNGCCSTSSGISQQVKIAGQSYGHILEPRTGTPVGNLQCGIISKDCLSGDILSTGFIHLSPEQFISTIEKLKDNFPMEGYLITKENRFVSYDAHTVVKRSN